MDAYGILVIILSVTLAIFLVLAIVLTVFVIKLVNTLRSIAAKAENIADNVEHVGELFRKTATPVAITNLISNMVSMFHKKKGK